MSPFTVVLLFCVVVSIVGCAALGTQTDPARRPPDFRVVYEWQEGSLPPPYHYEYVVTVTADGRGQIDFFPDYSGAAVPKWTESFTVSEDRLDALYQLMIDQGLLKTTWREMARPPVGGSHRSVDVTVGGRRVTVADYLIREQQTAASRIFQASKDLVPPDLFARLQAKRDAYVKQHER